MKIETVLHFCGLNSAQVTFYWTNSPTLDTEYGIRLGLANIEVAILTVSLGFQVRLLSYPLCYLLY